MYRLTGEKDYLAKAKIFARAMMSPEFEVIFIIKITHELINL